jgi:hypothetical protein
MERSIFEVLGGPEVVLLPPCRTEHYEHGIRIRVEDRLLASRFGEQFLAYRRVPAINSLNSSEGSLLKRF